MATSTVYLRPPEPRRRKVPTSSATREISGWLFRYRHQLAPVVGALWYAALAHTAWALHYGFILAGVCTAVGCVLIGRQGVRLRLRNTADRRHIRVSLIMLYLWALAGAWFSGTPRYWLVYILLCTALSVPWWHRYRVRGSIPVRFDDLSTAAQRARLADARALIREWTAFTSAGHLSGARVRALTYNPWSVVISIELRRGATVDEFTTRRLGKLESAFGDVRPGSARVERHDDHARLAVVRFMLEDPHASPIRPPELGLTDYERVVVGLFETGEEVVFQLIHTLIAGMSDAGKSGVIRVLIRAFAKMSHIAILGVDLKPGAPELGRWRPVMHELATTTAETAEMFAKVMEGMRQRGEIMRDLGWDVWHASADRPYVVLVIDEVQQVRRVGLARQLDDLIAMARQYGVFLILATQHPKTDNLSGTVKANCKQIVGLLVRGPNEDRIIFGESATADGWRASTINPSRPGSFMIKSPAYRTPMMARAYYVDGADVEREIGQLAAGRTPVDAGTWPTVVTVDRPALDAGPADDIQDAVIIADDPAELILEAVGRGLRSPHEIGNDLGISRATVYRHLKRLADERKIRAVSRGRYERT